MPQDDPAVESTGATSAGLYRRIWQITRGTQLVLIGLSVAVALLAAAPLHFQKELVNGLTYGSSKGHVFSLGAQFAAVVLLNVVLKFLLQYRGALLGEDVVRRIRGRIVTGTLGERRSGVPPPPAPGTLVTMLTAEAEDVGQFVGQAFATPLVQIGTLVSVLLYIGASEPLLGLVAFAVVAPQVAVVTAVQRRVNDLVRKRLVLLRTTADRTVGNAHVWAPDTILAGFDDVFEIRRRIYQLKLSSKAALNTLTGLGSVGILVLGGWLVLDGRTDVGTVVATLGGLNRMGRPWNELIKFYRTLSIVRVRFALLAEAIGQDRNPRPQD